MKPFGKWLVEKRESVGLTQEEVAKKAGCSRTYITILERDSPLEGRDKPTRPSIEKVDAIATALGVPVADAREAAGYLAPDQLQIPEESELLYMFRDLPPERRDEVIKIVQVLYRGYRELGLREIQPDELTEIP